MQSLTSRERGLKFINPIMNYDLSQSLTSRERGLKYRIQMKYTR